MINAAAATFVSIATSSLIAGTNEVDSAARKCLRLYAQGKIEALALTSLHGPKFESKLFSAYLLYRYKPKQFRSNFIHALPKTEKEFIKYVSIPFSLVIDEGAETYKVSRQDVPWPISFWDIHSAACELARQGNRASIRSVLALSGYGDGEIGEGMGEDARRLFDTPTTVARHWDLFQPHMDSLSCMRDDCSEDQVEKIKKGYISCFSHDQATLRQILELIEKGER